MADYYPLIARTIAGLDKSTGDARRQIYEHARAVLVAQLRGVKPTLDESDVTRERLALEEAIRKVEGESARQTSRSETGGRVKSPESSRWHEPEPDPLTALARQISQTDVFSDPNEKADRRKEEQWRQPEAEDAKRRKDEDEAAQRERRPRVIRAGLAEVASPAPSLAPDGRLDAGPNKVYDAPLQDNDLPALPIRQHTLIQTILNYLPGNAPKHLRASLENYDDELKARGVQPILGLLKDMVAIIEAAIGAPNARREWLAEGMCAAFELFSDNHALFVKHFPLDPKREELYAHTPVDENIATGSTLVGPFEEVAKAAFVANQAKLTTDDFLRIVDKMAEFAKVISTLPPSMPPTAPSTQSNSRDGGAESGFESGLPVVGPQGRLVPEAPPVSPKKRVLLSGLGFFERAYNLLGTTAQLMSPPPGNSLLTALRSAIDVLSRLIGS